MNRLSILKTVLVTVACLFTPQFGGYLLASSDEGAAKPNIIFILADDQGWNGTSVQMHPDLSLIHI